jgi:hypothetical protein
MSNSTFGHAKGWIEARASSSPGLARYLAAWGDWQDPRG